MHCVIAAEDKVIKEFLENLKYLKQIEPFSDWDFEICDHSWKLDEMCRKRPDVLVISSNLPGEDPEKLLKDLPVMFSSSHIVLYVGNLNEKARGYMRAAKKYGLENFVTGELPGDRPYTIVTALQYNRDNTIGIVELPEEETSDIEAPDNFNIKEVVEEVKENRTVNTGERPVFTPNATPMPAPPEPAPRSVERWSDQTELPVEQYALPKQQQIAYQQQPQFGSVFDDRQPVRWNTPRGHIISVIGNKGGVGKTTTSVTLAVALAQAGVEVAIVDIDLASPNVADFFKVPVKHGIEFLAGRDQGIRVILDQVLVPAPKYKNIHVLPGPVSKSIPVEAIFQRGELANILDALLERSQVVIADTPANFRICPWIPEVFQITDLALAVVDQSDFSEQDTARFAPEMLICGIHPQNIRIILNNFSPKLDNAKKVEKAFHAGFKKDVPKNQLPDIIATIPHDWDVHIKSGYKGEAVGLNDARSQWHRVAAEIASMVGRHYEKPEDKRLKKKNNKPNDNKKGLFGFLGRRN